MEKIKLSNSNWSNKYKNKTAEDISVIDFYEISKNRLRERWFTNKGLFELINDEPFIINLGKMVILENIISYHLALIINNKQNNKNSLLRYLDDNTLGSLVDLYAKLNIYNKKLYKKLKKFNTLRTNLTHNLHIGYKDINKAKKECSLIVKYGISLKDLLITNTQKIEKLNQKKFLKNIKIPTVLSSDMLKYDIEADKFSLDKKMKNLNKKYKIN